MRQEMQVLAPSRLHFNKHQCDERTLYVIKCPQNCSPREDKNSKQILTSDLENNPNTNVNAKDIKR